MFLKPLRIKSQTQLKGSEKKKFRSNISQMFPSLDENDLSSFFPNKVDVILIKAFSSKGDSLLIYQIQKQPMFFKLEKESELIPTVYFMWMFPSLMMSFTTFSNVIPKLSQGADLMLPGIVIEGQITPRSYGRFEKGELVSINTTDNFCPMAIGKTSLSSMDMYMSARQGKGVNVLHVYGDHLWEMGTKAKAPQIEFPISHSRGNSRTKLLGSESPANCPAEEPSTKGETPTDDCLIEALEGTSLAPTDGAASPEDTPEDVPDQPQISEAESMDHLFVHCFLKAWKTSAKKIDLPILTSNFYRLHMMPACPDNLSLEIKKSSYKKISKFLNEMAKRGIIVLNEFPKGVENITQVNYAHEDLVNFVVDLEETTILPSEPSSSEAPFAPPTLEEVYQVSGPTIQFFKANGLSKGDVLGKTEIRGVVSEYIKRKNLQKGSLVELDPLLHEAVVGPKEGYKETLRWDEIFSRLLGKMSPAFKITRPGQPTVIRKGKLEPIEIAVAKRSGNKKVTLIYNVGTFGIDENEFAHQVQIGVAASTSVTPAENRPAGIVQVLVQGHQVKFVGKLLLEKYNIPRKYIKGLELATKGKKF